MMQNPFEIINLRLANIESLLNDIKYPRINKIDEAEEKDLLTTKEAAEFLNLTIPTIYSKVSNKELPVMKGGKKLFFSKKELTEYIKQGRRKTLKEINEEANNYLKK